MKLRLANHKNHLDAAIMKQIQNDQLKVLDKNVSKAANIKCDH